MIQVTGIIWTLRDFSQVEPFLNEHFPERLAIPGAEGHFTVDGGAVWTEGRKVRFEERS